MPRPRETGLPRARARLLLGALLAVAAGWGAGDAAFRLTPLARALGGDPDWRARPHALESVHRAYLETPADAGFLRVADSHRIDLRPASAPIEGRIRRVALEARIPWAGVLDLRFPTNGGFEYALRLSRNARRPGGLFRVEGGRFEPLAAFASGAVLPGGERFEGAGGLPRAALRGLFGASVAPDFIARALESRLALPYGRLEAEFTERGLGARWDGAPLLAAELEAPATGLSLQGGEIVPVDVGSALVAWDGPGGAGAYATSFEPTGAARAARWLLIGAAIGALLPTRRSRSPWTPAPLLLAWLGRGGLLAGALLFALGAGRRSARRAAEGLGPRLEPVLRRAVWAAPPAVLALALIGSLSPAAALPAAALGAAGLLYLALLTLAAPRGAPGANRRLLLWTALLLLLGEWALRTSPAAEGLAPEWTRGREADKALFWRPDGFRGGAPDPEALVRVLAMGGSSTWGRGVDDPEEAWPARLEARLAEAAPGRFDVANAGVEGYTTFQALRFLARDLLRYRPDAVLWDFAHNDGTPSEWGLAYAEIDRRLNAASGAVSALQRALSHVRLYQAMKLGLLRARSGLLGKLFAGAQTNNVPLADFSENLRAFVALGREKGFEPILVIEPTYDDLFGAGRLAPYREAARAVALETGSAWVDPLPILAAHRDDDLFLDNVHPTPLGHGLIAEAIREQVGPRLLALSPRALP